MIDAAQWQELKFGGNGLIPVVAQAYDTKAVLMLAYANEEALRLTLETKRAHYYSRSRKSLWLKGETSGHFQHIVDVRTDCDDDALLYIVRQEGVACHTGRYSCFESREGDENAAGGIAGINGDTLFHLQSVVADRLTHPKEGSYTNYLFTKGLDKILKKVGEESAEVIIAAKNKSADELRYETADLLYHLTVLLTEARLQWSDIFEELNGRVK